MKESSIEAAKGLVWNMSNEEVGLQGVVGDCRFRNYEEKVRRRKGSCLQRERNSR